MLRLLLDSHVPRAVAVRLAERHGIDAIHLTHWHGGRFLHAVDSEILLAASVERLTLVTYDLRTIQPLVVDWVTSGRRHSGVIFVDDRAIAQHDVGGLIRSLAALHQSEGAVDWEDRVLYLRPVRR